MGIPLNYVQGAGGYYNTVDNSGPYSISSAGVATLLGAGGGGGGEGGASSVSVSNFPVTQPVSAAALPLPAGAATATGVTAVATNVGPATARAAVTNPAAAADVNQLLRGILTALNEHTVLLQTIATNTTPSA